MKKIIEFVTRHPKKIITIIILITLPMCYFSYKAFLNPNTDLLSYLPENEPVIKTFNDIGNTFGGTDTILIGIEDNRDLFSREMLEKLQNLCDDIEKIRIDKETYRIALKSKIDKLNRQGNQTEAQILSDEYLNVDNLNENEMDYAITNVTSLINIMDIKVIEDEFGRRIIDPSDLIEELPENEEESNAIRVNALSDDTYRGSIVSYDGRKTAILCRISGDASRSHTVLFNIKSLLDQTGFDKIYIAGSLYIGNETKNFAIRDLLLLLPFAVLLVLFVLAYSFRTIRGVVLPLITVLISTVWTCGIINISGYELSIISMTLPIILIAVGSAYGIHVVNKYYEESRLENASKSNKELVINSITHVVLPVLMAGITTIVGFATFVTSDILPIRDFGFFSSLGVLLAIIIAVIFIPSFFSILKIKQSPGYFDPEHKPEKVTIVVRMLDALSGFVYKRYKLILIISIIIVAISGYFSLNLKIETNDQEWFSKDSYVRKAIDFINENFNGSTYFQILFTVSDQDENSANNEQNVVRSPAFLLQMKYIQDYMQSQIEDLKSPLSIVNLITEMNNVMYDQNLIPQYFTEVEDLWEFIKNEEILDQMITEDGQKTMIQAAIPSLNSIIIDNAINSLTAFMTQNIPGSVVDENDQYHISGNIVQVLKDQIADNQEFLNILLARQKMNLLYSISNNADILNAETADRLIDEAQKNSSIEILSELKTELENQINAYFLNAFLFNLDDNSFLNSISQEVINQINNLLPLSYMEKVNLIEQTIIRFLPEDLINENPMRAKQGAKRIADLIENTIIQSGAKSLIDELLSSGSIQIKQTLDRNVANIEGIDEFNERYNNIIKSLHFLSQDWFISTPQEMEHFGLQEIINDENPVIGINIYLNGMPVTMKLMDELILKSQIMTLFICLAVIFILMAIMLKSLVKGLISLIPITMTILINFGVMAFFEIRLDIATTLISSIAIGIGIDYTIHFLSRYNKELQSPGADTWHALKITLETTGKAITFNALTVALGFAILGFGNLILLKVFGLLIAMTMIVSGLAAITVMPATLLAIYHKKNPESSGVK